MLNTQLIYTTQLITASNLSVGTVELLIKTYPDGKVSGYMNALKVKICGKKIDAILDKCFDTIYDMNDRINCSQIHDYFFTLVILNTSHNVSRRVI